MNAGELTATWSRRMLMLLLPWRRASLLCVTQYDSKTHLSDGERSERGEFRDDVHLEANLAESA